MNFTAKAHDFNPASMLQAAGDATFCLLFSQQRFGGDWTFAPAWLMRSSICRS
jgi:hypothetical protein